MLDNPIFLLVISTIFAAIPAGIWLYIFFSKSEKSKKTVAAVFALGCLTAPALLGLQYLWDIFPNFNLAAFIEDSVTTQSTMFIFMFVLFGALEEIFKMFIVKSVDQKTLLIKTVNDAIRYSIASALAFSFVENIYYLYEFWPVISTGELLGMYIFRSLFTACAHMIFSGVFGYYYGIGKFSILMRTQGELTGKTSLIAKGISRLFSIPLSEGYRQNYVVKGLFIAIFMHAIFNYLLQYNIIYPVIIFVVLGFLFLRYLLKRKAGHLVLTIDPSTQKPSTMPKKDEEVVIELLGMWFRQKNYTDVIHICDRLLERDKDNPVVKMFKAQAMDKMDNSSQYKNLLGSFFKSKKTDIQEGKNIISHYTEEQEMFERVKKMVKKQLKKEGKKFKEDKAAPRPKKKKKKKVKSTVENLSKGKSFRLR